MSNKESIDMDTIKKIFKDMPKESNIEGQKKESLSNDKIINNAVTDILAKIPFNAETQSLTPNEIKSEFIDLQKIIKMRQDKITDPDRIEICCQNQEKKDPQKDDKFIDRVFDKKTKIGPISINSCSSSAFKSEHVREVFGKEERPNVIDIQKIELAEQENKWKTVTVSDKTKVGKRIDEVFDIRPKIDSISIDGCSLSEIRPSLSEREIKTTLTEGRHETLDAIFDDCIDKYDNANLKKMIIINDNILIHEQSMGKIEILGVKVTIIIAFDNKIDSFREFEIVDHNKIYVPFADKNKIKCAIAMARELIRFFKL